MFHRVDDWTQLDSPRYFRLAALLPYYSGAVQTAVRVDLQKTQPPAAQHDQQHPSSLHPASGGEPARVVDDLRAVAAMTAHPGFAGVEYEGG